MGMVVDQAEMRQKKAERERESERERERNRERERERVLDGWIGSWVFLYISVAWSLRLV